MTDDPQHVDLRRKLDTILDSLASTLPANPDDLRTEVKKLANSFLVLREYSKARISRLVSASAARERILQYLRLFVGQPIDGDELEVVSAIHEYPRRIRELRVEHGYRIRSGVTSPDLRPDEYLLESAEPNAEEAERWRTANKIRKQKGGGKSRMLALLKEYLGKPVSADQLLYVAKVKDMRRVRELRTEDGWRITTRFTGRPTLPPDMYVLETDVQLPPHDRDISSTTYDEVLHRDNYRCRKCGWRVEDRRPEQKRQFIELHHVEHHKDGGTNNMENLITLCNVHHDEAHRSRSTGAAFWDWLGNSASIR